MNATLPTAAPWYRHPIVWLIVAIPATAMLMGVVIITLSIQVPESVVRDDYYQAGRTINIDLHATHRAAELGIEATLLGSPEDGWLIDVKQQDGRPADAPVDVLLAHPTLAERDLAFSVPRLGDGWSGFLDPMGGRRILSLRSEADGWLLRREVRFDDTASGAITLRAEPWGSVP